LGSKTCPPFANSQREVGIIALIPICVAGAVLVIELLIIEKVR
jgi:hypothetical protein